MEKKIMNEIKAFAVKRCQEEFGFAGVAEGEDMIMINSGKEKDLIINIKIEDGMK